MTTLPALSAACLEELSQQIAQYGLGPVLYEIRRAAPSLTGAAA
jgi:hypothetical protein